MKARNYLILGVGLCVLLCAFTLKKGWTHDDHYRGWLQPGTNNSCCNERIEKDGTVTGDCSEVDAEMRNGVWFAYIPFESRWIEVPDDRLVRKHPKIYGKATLCYNPHQKKVLCFAQPRRDG